MHKRMMIGLLTLLVAFAAFAQERDEDGYSIDDLKAKAAKYRGVQTGGFVLLGLGGVSLISGIALMSTAHWDSYSTGTGVGATTRDSQGGAGIIMTAIGVPFTVAGIVLAAIGTSKYREYKERAFISTWYDPAKKKAALSVMLNFAVPAAR
jgi:hypothetical protein